MQALLEIDRGLRVAQQSVPRLERLHKEKMEKMKDEAIGELSKTTAPCTLPLKMCFGVSKISLQLEAAVA